jgi:hypothetical protein
LGVHRLRQRLRQRAGLAQADEHLCEVLLLPQARSFSMQVLGQAAVRICYVRGPDRADAVAEGDQVQPGQVQDQGEMVRATRVEHVGAAAELLDELHGGCGTRRRASS